MTPIKCPYCKINSPVEKFEAVNPGFVWVKREDLDTLFNHTIMMSGGQEAYNNLKAARDRGRKP